LMPDTAKELGVNPHDIPQNIDGGLRYLKAQTDKFGVPMGLAAYNAGPGRVQKHLETGSPLPSETQNYIPAVLANAKAMGPSTPLSAQAGPPQIPGSAPVLPSEGFTPGPTNAPVPMPGSPAATPPPAMPSQPRPPGLMDGMSQLAQLFGGQQQQAAAAPPMPQQQGHGINPIAIQAIAQMMKNPSYGKGALAHRFYSRGQA
jgi:hypothetical protein